ncbi:MAG: antitoxin, partial [Deltaproteobacteria bacterium]
GLKNFDKVTSNSVLPKYPQVEWKKAKGLRDIISHHYFDVNAEAIFKVCKDHIHNLGETIKKIIDEI